MNERVNIVYNNDELSKSTYRILAEKLHKSGYIIQPEFKSYADITFVIGGDGLFLDTVQKYEMPQMPIIGINTGHLGFFQEVTPDAIDEFLFKYSEGNYTIQDLPIVKIKGNTPEEDFIHYGLNDVYIRGGHTKLLHLNISIGDTYIERFSGDGILVATSAGSTAYNYSLGGSIVDPRLKLLQITPIAPMNTVAYRSFTSSVLLPSDHVINIVPELRRDNHSMYIMYDGKEKIYDNVEKLTISYSDKIVKLIRLDEYSFWDKVKSKFL